MTPSRRPSTGRRARAARRPTRVAVVRPVSLAPTGCAAARPVEVPVAAVAGFAGAPLPVPVVSAGGVSAAAVLPAPGKARRP